MNLAQQLLQTRSVQIRPQEPFRLTSGRLSPVYVDVRRLISFPQIRTEITESFAKIAQERIGLSQIDVIAGGETAGIAYAALLAEKLNKPMIYVRKEPKGYGKSSQIEGVLEPGQRVLLVEDLVTDGGSKLNFQRGIESAGGTVHHCLCVFEYFSHEAGCTARGIRSESTGSSCTPSSRGMTCCASRAPHRPSPTGNLPSCCGSSQSSRSTARKDDCSV
jgi:orotate phosphoribosyltransferase